MSRKLHEIKFPLFVLRIAAAGGGKRDRKKKSVKQFELEIVKNAFAVNRLLIKTKELDYTD